VPTLPPSPDQLLCQAIRVLGLGDGCLLPASAAPVKQNQVHWVDKGDWLALAEQLGAESVFFVGNEPVLVVAKLPEGEDARQFFNRIWCMARPQFLFLASRGQLEAYQLNQPPVRAGEELRSSERLLAMASQAADVQEQFSAFHRQKLETGQIYGDERFESGAFRADRALVHDLKIVRRLLIDDGLAPTFAHSLIGRALFIRYLEDRKILLPEYFESIADEKPTWGNLLQRSVEGAFAEPEFEEVLFFRVLGNKQFTYALFDRLAADFNGDTFPVTSSERRQVKPSHIDLLRRLFLGDAIEGQGQLFLFAYRFEVVPIELISSIYEEFYTARQGKGKTQSTYYTPPALADYLLSQVLTPKILSERPRVIDPACGSGIFLVEAFRRMVRYRVSTQGRRLRQNELLCILRDQIRGIDLNPEAVPIAAFSLYLAYLHYQFPREINDHRKLPNLRLDETREKVDEAQYFDVLYAGNAFDAITCSDDYLRSRFGPGCADIVVGNPPWGEVKRDDQLGKSAWPATDAWCKSSEGRAIGDKEQSQAFVHLAIELLTENGTAALLLSSGVLFKQHDNSKKFRKQWLGKCRLEQVINFAHVRHIYFSDPPRRGAGRRASDGAAPFISAIFQKSETKADHRFAYWSAKRTATVENSRAIVLNSSDMHWLSQKSCVERESLWKTYWWGGRRDDGLIRSLERFPPLSSLADDEPEKSISSGRGFEKSGENQSDWLAQYLEFPVRNFTRYGNVQKSDLRSVPRSVYRRGCREIYEGHRLLLKRGIGKDGLIVSRLETEEYCFRNSIQGFRICGFRSWEEKLIIAVLWSSLARYYFWLTAGSWGMWHDELHLHIVSNLPMALDCAEETKKEIVETVERLQQQEPVLDGELEGLERRLDQLVFDLYQLTAADRDLIRNMCQLGIDFFYNRGNSIAVDRVVLPKELAGTAERLPRCQSEGILGYLQVFLEIWNTDLAPEAELSWKLISGGSSAPILALLFSVMPPDDHVEISGDQDAWDKVLTRLANASYVPIDGRQTLYSDTFIRSVGENEILIIKRDELRHWSRSSALEDADATIAQAMRLAEKELV